MSNKSARTELQAGSSDLRTSRVEVHRALTMPELLSLSFRYLSGNDVTTVARVCQHWSRIAVDLLWRTYEVPLSTILEELNFLLYEEDDEMWFPPVSQQTSQIVIASSLKCSEVYRAGGFSIRRTCRSPSLAKLRPPPQP